MMMNVAEWFFTSFVRYGWQPRYAQGPDFCLLPFKYYLQFSVSVTISLIADCFVTPFSQVWVAVTLRAGSRFWSGPTQRPWVHCTHSWLQTICGLLRWTIHSPWRWRWSWCRREAKVGLMAEGRDSVAARSATVDDPGTERVELVCTSWSPFWKKVLAGIYSLNLSP